LTISRVIAIARDQAPQVLESDTRVAEARGRLIRARAWSNPEIEAVTGRTDREEQRAEVELSVAVGPGIKRSRRVEAAMAELRAEELEAREVRRLAVGAALEAYFRALHVEGRLAVARRRLDLAEQLDRLTRERVRSGDAALLESRVAEVELSRARSEILSEEQEVASTRLELALALGLPTPSVFAIGGELADRSFFEGLPDEPDIDGRPDVLALENRVKAAAAEQSLAGASVLPDVSFRLKYDQEAEGRAWMPGVALTLPLFDRGQGERAQARARLERSRLELARRRVIASASYDAARRRYEAAVAAVQELETRGIPRSAEVESMVEESYRAGKTDLGSLLVLRRDALETRREYVNRLLDAAVRGVELALATGQWPLSED
jgi:cobalt-zinc-cadmium efflux system outer membrane protein